MTDDSTEKINRDLDDLTPLDARNSLLIDPMDYKDVKNFDAKSYPMGAYSGRRSSSPMPPYRDETPPPRQNRGARDSSENLVGSAAKMGYSHERSTSRDSDGLSPPPVGREPTIPNLGYRGQAY